MPLAECLLRLSHREYLTWLSWLQLQDNEPTVDQYYLMQIAQEVRRGYAKKPKTVKLEHMKLKFKSSVGTITDPKAAAATAKTRWLTAIGVRHE